MGTIVEAEGLRGFLRYGVLPGAGVAILPDLPESVEVNYRSRSGQRYAFYLNHSSAPVTVALAKPGMDLLMQTAVSGELVLPGFGVSILKEN